MEEINNQKKILDNLILSNASEKLIYETSIKIDKLLLEHYKQDTILKNLT